MGFGIGIVIGLIIVLYEYWPLFLEYFLVSTPFIFIGAIFLFIHIDYPFAITNYPNLNWLLSILSLGIPVFLSYMIHIKVIPRFPRGDLMPKDPTDGGISSAAHIFGSGITGFLIEIFLKWLFAK